MADGKCSKCGKSRDVRICKVPGGEAPEQCCTTIYKDTLERAKQVYESDEKIMKFAAEAARQESACYSHPPKNSGEMTAVKPRIIETIEFCKRMNYKRLGLAFCGGLHYEGMLIGDILERHGFEVVSALCKVGCVDKSFLGLEDDDKINGSGHESMCNPIGQAMIMNEAKTDFNIVFGLCVGHDSLFLKHSVAMCSVFAVKDRVLGHNPMAAIYTSRTYYSYIKDKIKKEDDNS